MGRYQRYREKYSCDAADVRDPKYNEETVESRDVWSRLREFLDKESMHHRLFRKRREASNNLK